MRFLPYEKVFFQNDAAEHIYYFEALDKGGLVASISWA